MPPAPTLSAYQQRLPTTSDRAPNTQLMAITSDLAPTPGTTTVGQFLWG
ncbi:MAG: hypothetical protein R3B47_07490 [Bacteroidia bacterium]